MSQTTPPLPHPGRRERKRQLTADHLADTAWELFNTHGFAQVSMEAIAEAADVAKGTLYKHFPVKEALLRHRFHRELAEQIPGMLEAMSSLPSAEACLRAFFSGSADWSVSRREYLAHYVHFRLTEIGTGNGLDPEKRSGLDSIFTTLIRNGQQRGEFKRELSEQHLAQYLQFMYLACLMRWLHIPTLDLQQEFTTMLDLFLDGMRSR